MKRKNFPKRREQRRKEAEARNAAYQALSTEQKIARLPEGGAEKQRAKLQAQS